MSQDSFYLNPVVTALTQRAECLGKQPWGAVYAWQCWCSTCTENIVQEYGRDPNVLPVTVAGRVADAVARYGSKP